MNYNYVLSTGDSSISGSLYNLLSRNRVANFDGNNFLYDSDLITGRHSMLASLNSQTLFEESPEIYSGANNTYYSINTGNFYLKKENLFDSSKLFLDESLLISTEDILFYDHREEQSGFAIFKTGDALDSWNENISGLVDVVEQEFPAISTNNLLFQNFDIFINGQKIHDTGSVSDLDVVTGLLFAIPKKSNISESTLQVADLYGAKFIEKQVDYYINGMEQSNINFLELYTGVYKIEQHNSSVSLFNLESTTYTL